MRDPPSDCANDSEDNDQSPSGINTISRHYSQHNLYYPVHVGSGPPTWQEELHKLNIKAFEAASGPTVDIPDSPEDVFQLFFDESLQSKESNKYARQVMG